MESIFTGRFTLAPRFRIGWERCCAIHDDVDLSSTLHCVYITYLSRLVSIYCGSFALPTVCYEPLADTALWRRVEDVLPVLTSLLTSVGGQTGWFFSMFYGDSHNLACHLSCPPTNLARDHWQPRLRVTSHTIYSIYSLWRPRYTILHHFKLA